MIITLAANCAWQLGVNYSGSGWSCPGSYDKAESDLLVKISNTPTGTVQNSYDSYQSPTGAKTAMLTHTSGVSRNAVSIQTKVLIGRETDIPGAYSIGLVYTVETTGSLRSADHDAVLTPAHR